MSIHKRFIYHALADPSVPVSEIFPTWDGTREEAMKQVQDGQDFYTSDCDNINSNGSCGGHPIDPRVTT